MPEPTVLLVEDDHALRDVLARALREEGCTVLTSSTGRGALDNASAPLAAVVLDIGLPDADGRDVCAALRSRGNNAPVIFLTARDSVVDRLSGFSSGGDDYLTKPFHVAELLARLRALLRRTSDATTSTSTGLVLDPARHALTRDGVDVALSPTEFRLMGALLARPGTVLRRAELQRAGWPEGAIVHDNTLDQYVARIRRKLEETGAPDRIETVRGVGYRVAS